MDIKMPCGAILCTEDNTVIEQYIKYGGVEVKPKAQPKADTKKAPATKTNKAE